MHQKRKILEHWQVVTILLMIYDIAAVTLSYFLGLWLRFDLRYSQIDQRYLTAWLRFAPIYAVFCVIVFSAFRLYRSIWPAFPAPIIMTREPVTPGALLPLKRRTKR